MLFNVVLMKTKLMWGDIYFHTMLAPNKYKNKDEKLQKSKRMHVQYSDTV